MLQKKVLVLAYLHNNSTTIEACLNSIIDTPGNIIKEIIVIDDGSTDGGSELLNAFPQVKIVSHNFQGIVKSINSQLCNIVDDDLVRINCNVVIKTGNWLEQFQTTAYEKEETGIVGARLLLADNRIESDGRIFISGLGYEERHSKINALKNNDDCKKQILEVDSVSSSLCYYKNGVFKKAGFFDENYYPLLTEDDDYCITVRRNNFSVITNSFIQAYHFITLRTPADSPFNENDKKFEPVIYDGFKYIQLEHFKYWKEKWLWNPLYPDLNLIRDLYGNTKICWNIGEKLRFKSKEEFPAVDICLVTWNNLSLLKRMLESLSLTDYPKDKIKVYITDNGSSDGTIEYLKRLSGEFIFGVCVEFLPANSGVAYGLNLAVIKGRGELVARLDDDIILPPDWLKELVKVILKRPYCGMAGVKILNDNPLRLIQCSDFKMFPKYTAHEYEIDNGQADYYSKTAHLRGCCNLYRRDVFTNCGLFDVRFSPSQFDDPDHQVAVLARGYEIIYNGHVNVVHKHNSGITGSFAGLSNQTGNKVKFFGKWGSNIYDILDRSIELSFEGRKIDLNNPKSFTVKNTNRNISYASADNFYGLTESIINFKLLKQNEFNSLVDNILMNALNAFRSNCIETGFSSLHTALILNPVKVSTILFMYAAYLHFGILDKAEHFKSLLQLISNNDIINLHHRLQDKLLPEIIYLFYPDLQPDNLNEFFENLLVENIKIDY